MRKAVLLINGRRVSEVLIADTFWGRFRGMLWRSELPPALLLRGTNSVHGMGMRASLDVASLAADGRVLSVAVLRPARMTASVPGCVDVLEAPAGNFARWGVGVGSTVTIAD